MTPEEINTAIHQACPELFTRPIGGLSYYYRFEGRLVPCLNGNIFEDLNAMHEAEKVFEAMEYSFKNKYAGTLEDILETEIKKDDPDCIPDVWGFEMVNATATQRAEAFLRTSGKWKD